jgi:predicted nucleic acid-binding protein
MLRTPDLFELFAPALINHELEVHHRKLMKISKLNDEAITIAKDLIMGRIHRVDDALITASSWQDAEKLLGPIDAFDVPYLALALELDCILWTGDRKVFKGLRKRGFRNVIDTAELLRLRDGL